MAKKKKNNNIAKEEHLVVKGTVEEALPGTKFKVLLKDVEKYVVCTLSGKLRMNKITIVPGDSVEVKLSPYDLNQGIISWRFT